MRPRERVQWMQAYFVSNPPLLSKRFVTHRWRVCVASTARSFAVLGGSSGVGLETVKYLRANGAQARAFSRSTGYDFTKLSDCEAAVDNAKDGVAICIGAGRRQSSYAEEIALYSNISQALQAVDARLVVAVVRTLVLSEVTHILTNSLASPWVILRPGAMDSGIVRQGPQETPALDESLVVTPDMRCNGLVTRCGVARVTGDLLLGRIANGQVNRKVLGVYDQNRMISKPTGCTVIGVDLWLGATN